MEQSKTTDASGGGELWCMHIQGPDDLHAAPDFWTALAWAAELNTFIAAKAIKGGWATDDNYPLSQATVRPWIGTPESHAVHLSIELADRAEHAAKREAALASAPLAPTPDAEAFQPKIETCPKCGAKGAAFICDTEGCPVNGGAAYPWTPAPTPEAGSDRLVCEALGFDPTNHHNALKCPYCNPKGLSFASPPPAEDLAGQGEPVAWASGGHQPHPFQPHEKHPGCAVCGYAASERLMHPQGEQK